MLLWNLVRLLAFHEHFLTPSDLIAIGYVIANSQFLTKTIVLDKCKFGKEGMVQLSGLEKSKGFGVST